jgi:hypothetical protein
MGFRLGSWAILMASAVKYPVVNYARLLLNKQLKRNILLLWMFRIPEEPRLKGQSASSNSNAVREMHGDCRSWDLVLACRRIKR